MSKGDSIFLVEPYYGASHKYWVDCLMKYASSPIKKFTLKGVHWKWRMASGAISLAAQINEEAEIPKVFFVTDMLDVGLFKSLLNDQFKGVPIVLYFHENQLTYPWNSAEYQQRDRHYAWLNFTSMLVADKIVFSTQFHMDVVFESLPIFLNAFPDKLATRHIPSIKDKSTVITPGIEAIQTRNTDVEKGSKPRILWNHRWEHDKNPDLFFNTLYRLKAAGYDFELTVCGESFAQNPAIFDEAKIKLASNIVHWGFFKDKETYLNELWKCHLLPVTTNQEFFGLSVLEAAFCDVRPLLPQRLSYPDLYAGLDIFYKDDDDLYQQLISELENLKPFKLPAKFTKYQWDELIKEYDALWSTL